MVLIKHIEKRREEKKREEKRRKDDSWHKIWVQQREKNEPE